MKYLGLVREKKEGCAIHPDDTEANFTDKQYEMQLRQHYIDLGAGISEKTIQQFLDARALASRPSGFKPNPKRAVGKKKFTPGTWNISKPSGEDSA